ncbi:MAG: nicotinate (nicotinamide) nucleotide adenylyltransferase [Clostridiales Family XIII bacterium]|jgi:nicotinate-nucleotide adenylyltransferase|nr:nicotinate (nicotinamide) nucleotide adenylyltransferase [Clostridiales Family XIII bacterium]
MNAKIGVFGGSFDPVHIGHLMLAEHMLEAGGLDKVIFMPTYIQPFKQDNQTASSENRLQMLRLATSDNARFEVSDVELRRASVSYTIDSLRELQQEYPQDNIYFIVGVDIFRLIRKWYKFEELVSEFSFLVGVRPGYDISEVSELITDIQRDFQTDIRLIENPLIDIASSNIRNRMKLGFLAGADSVQYELPASVYDYIYAHGIYEGTTLINQLRIDLSHRVSQRRYEHVLRVEELSVRLSMIFGENVVRTRLAAVAHDICKDKDEEGNALLHSKHAEKMLRDMYGVMDEDVLNAVSFHTTGRAAMSRLEMIIFLADAIEPGREYPVVHKIRLATYESLEAGMKATLEDMDAYLSRKGLELSGDTAAALAYYNDI